MYRVLKEKGNNQNIILENTETKGSMIIGKLTMTIMRELEKEITFDESRDDAVKLKDKWDFEVSSELAKELMKLASPIKKPVRSKTSKSEQAQPIQEKPKKKLTKSGREVVDVFDLIYGTN